MCPPKFWRWKGTIFSFIKSHFHKDIPSIKNTPKDPKENPWDFSNARNNCRVHPGDNKENMLQYLSVWPWRVCCRRRQTLAHSALPWLLFDAEFRLNLRLLAFVWLPVHSQVQHDDGLKRNVGGAGVVFCYLVPYVCYARVEGCYSRNLRAKSGFKSTIFPNSGFKSTIFPTLIWWGFLF